MPSDNFAQPPDPVEPRLDPAEPPLEPAAPPFESAAPPFDHAELPLDHAESSLDPPPPPFDLTLPPAGPAFPSSESRSGAAGLATWFALLAVFGVGGLLLGQQELAMLTAMAGLFVAAQAADLDAQWRVLYRLVAWVVPLGGAAVFAALGFMLHPDDLSPVASRALTGLCFGATVASLLTIFRPFANAIASAAFRTPSPSHTLRLAARLVFLTLLFVLPGWFAVRNLFEQMNGHLDVLVEGTSLGSGLIGYLLLALASVGWLLRRDGRATLARLGVTVPTLRHLLVAVLAVVGLFAFNGGADWLQRTFFNDLWLRDQRMNEAIGSNLGVAGTIVLGVSAGIGEEITLRGALQPRLGLWWTSLLFASLHVQYSWFGMLAILALGLILGTIRQRTSTTVAMIAHGLYDIAAVMTMDRPT